MSQSKTIERVREIRAQLNEEIAAVDRKISERHDRKMVLERTGLVPIDEALARFERDLDSMASEGEAKLKRVAENYGTANMPTYSRLSWVLGVHNLPNGTVSDPGPVLAHLSRDQILAEARKFIEQRHANPDNAHRLVPAAEEREAELRQLEEELDQLKADRDALQDELAQSFHFDKSQATQDQERRDREQGLLDTLNKAGREPDPEPASAINSPDF